MPRTSIRKQMLIRPRESEYPEYSELLRLLNLHKNKFSRNLKAHLINEDLKVFMFVMQDHYSYLNESLYNKVIESKDVVRKIINDTINSFETLGASCFCRYLGIRKYEERSIRDISRIEDTSASTVNRRISALSELIRDNLNDCIFPEVKLPKVYLNVESEEHREALYDNGKLDLKYNEFKEKLFQSTKSPFSRDSLSFVVDRNLRAAIGSFRDNEHDLTENVYNSLVKNREKLEEVIISSAKSAYSEVSANAYLAYWQLGEFSTVKMSPEQMAERSNFSVTTIRRRLQNIAQRVNIAILELLRSQDQTLHNPREYASRSIDVNYEKKLIEELILHLGLNATVESVSCSKSTLEVLRGIFEYFSIQNAVTARMLLNGCSIEQVKQTLKCCGIDNDSLTDGAFRSRKVRFIKSLKEEFKVIRVNGYTTLSYKKRR